MTEVIEFEALTESIGAHAVQALGSERLRELTVVLDINDMTCLVSVCLRKNTDSEQQEALELLFDIQNLFFDEVSMSFDFGTPDSSQVATTEMQRQFSFA
jgi:hypothetical protein